jgi:hypothetical protein
MRRPILLAGLVAGAVMALWSAPSSATQPVAKPEDRGTLVTRTADTKATAAAPERKRRAGVVRRHDVDEYWRHRLGDGRWVHYQYINAGYPAYPSRYAGVHHVYFPGTACCGYRRHWPWVGRTHWHGPKYWPWMGRHRHHHHW